MNDWQNLPSELQSLMEKRVSDRRSEENGNAPDEERRQNDRRGQQPETDTPTPTPPVSDR